MTIQLPLGNCLGMVAPYYNLALVLIVLIMFFRLFRMHNKKIFLLPWKLLFVAVTIYIVEELLTVLTMADIFYVPRIMNGVFEFVIITIFIYLLLKQREFLEQGKLTKKQNVK